MVSVGHTIFIAVGRYHIYVAYLITHVQYGISQSCHLYLCRPVPHPPSIFDHYVYHNSNLGKQYWVGRLDPFVHSISRLSGGPTITSIYSNLGKQYWVGRLDPFVHSFGWLSGGPTITSICTCRGIQMCEGF
jgi:hypothetical protein